MNALAAPAPVSTPAPAATPTVEDNSAKESAADMDQIREVMARHKLAVEPATTKNDAPATTAKTDAVDTGADNSPAPVQAAPTLSEADSRLLQAFQIDADDLPADPARREKVLGRYRDVAAANARLASENGRLKKTQPAAAQQAAQPATEPVDQAWAEVGELLGMLDETAAPKFQKAISQIVAAKIAEATQGQSSIQAEQIRRMENDDFDRGLAKVTFPEGLHKTDAKIRETLMASAKLQFQAEAASRAARGLPPVNLAEFSLEHAVERAVPIVFAEQFQSQAKKAATERRNAQIAGLPDSGTRSPTTRAKVDPEEADLGDIRDVLKKHNLPVGV